MDKAQKTAKKPKKNIRKEDEFFLSVSILSCLEVKGKPWAHVPETVALKKSGYTCTVLMKGKRFWKSKIALCRSTVR